jgi:16S rRNA (cytidine1402-2'-O)-methyltransferase
MLYFVGTPLGVLSDSSLRSAQVLCSSDIILCEDTRSFSPYYASLQVLYTLQPLESQKIMSYHDQNEFEKLPEILNYLDDNLTVSIVSEAGMPVVSDPGSQLLQMIVRKGHSYTVVPGPTALTTAMTHAGISSNTLFVGFLPKKESQSRKLLLEYLSISIRPLSLVLYESPHRIQATLELLNQLTPDSYLVLCREMTKKFEEIVRGKPSDLMHSTYKGEITLVVQLS